MAGRVVFFVLIVVLLKKASSQSCPPGTPVVRCKADPCTVNHCLKYPNAECRANYCGGCNADFYLKGRKVDCENYQKTTTAKPQCPPGKPLVQCFVDPCQVNKCPNFPNAICKANYCGGCNAEFYVQGRKVDCGKKHQSATTTTEKPVCPPGKPLVRCFADPCQVTKCPNYPDATCNANYCGGCNADFYVQGRKVDCGKKSATTPKPGCPPDKPLVQCFDNPCRWAKCTEHPDAVCKPDYCGGCNAVFYAGGRQVVCVIESSPS